MMGPSADAQTTGYSQVEKRAPGELETQLEDLRAVTAAVELSAAELAKRLDSVLRDSPPTPDREGQPKPGLGSQRAREVDSVRERLDLVNLVLLELLNRIEV